MIWEIVKEGWNAWKSHKVSGVPFFISGIVSTSIFSGAAILLITLISPELFGVVLSGEFTEEYLDRLIERYMENSDLIVSVALVAMVLFTVSDTFFRAWGIKVCSDSLSCQVSLSACLKYARSRYLPYLTFSLILLGVNLASLLPLYNFLKGVDWSGEEGIVAAVLFFVVYGLLWLGFVLFITFLVTFVPYAIVLDREGVVGGIRRGFKILSRSLMETIIFWLIVALVGTAVGVPFYPLKFLGTAGEIANFALTSVANWLVAMPITTMWWIGLYRRKASQL